MPRYIDKDKLIERMKGKKSVEWFNEIYAMEEADVQEVKHARWIDIECAESIMCSACSHFTSDMLGDFIKVDDDTAK